MSTNSGAKEVSEMLETVTEKIPQLIKGIMDSYFTADAGKQIGRAVGSMYKELIEAGMTKEDAITIARDYMNTVKELQRHEKVQVKTMDCR